MMVVVEFHPVNPKRCVQSRARVIENAADTHDDHVGEKRRRGHRNAHRGAVQDAIVSKRLERVNEQVAPHIRGLVVVMVLV